MLAEITDLRIRNSSQELLQEVIDTFPLTTKYFKIRLLTGGVPLSMNFEEPGKFVKECLAREVVPYSEVIYRFEDGLFFPHNFRVWPPKCEFDKREMQRAIALFQPHEKIFEAEFLEVDRAFDIFKNLLPFFVSRSDKIDSGQLATSTYRLTGYNQGDYFSTGIRFGDNRLGDVSSGLTLTVNSQGYGGELEPDDKGKLVSWFEGLKDKYDRHQAVFF